MRGQELAPAAAWLSPTGWVLKPWERYNSCCATELPYGSSGLFPIASTKLPCLNVTFASTAAAATGLLAT